MRGGSAGPAGQARPRREVRGGGWQRVSQGRRSRVWRPGDRARCGKGCVPCIRLLSSLKLWPPDTPRTRGGLLTMLRLPRSAAPAPPLSASLPICGSLRGVWFELLNPPISARAPPLSRGGCDGASRPGPRGLKAGLRSPGRGHVPGSLATWPGKGYIKSLGGRCTLCFSLGLLGSLSVGDTCPRPLASSSLKEPYKSQAW